MESIEQNSSHPKRKFPPDDEHEHIYSFDIEHDSSKKTFCSRPSTSATHLHPPAKSYALGNYQQTTKIIQEFNIQQSTSTSDITVSSTINIKSSAKPSMKTPWSSNQDLLSEADFQRVVQDITQADRDLFDEFLNGIKQKTDDYLFLSTFDDLPASSSSSSSSHEQNSLSHRQSSSSTLLNDSHRQRHSLPRGSNTIHYNPHPTSHSNRPSTNPTNSAPAAQTLKQMAVQHQQRIIYNQQQQNNSIYTNYSSNEHFPTQYYQQSQTISETINSIDSTCYYPSMHHYTPVQSNNVSPYPSSNSFGMTNNVYQSSSSFYPSQGLSTSSYPSNSLPLSTNATSSFNCQDDFLPLLDL